MFNQTQAQSLSLHHYRQQVPTLPVARARQPWGAPALSRDLESLTPCRELVNYGRTRLAYHLILRVGTSRTTDCADNLALLDQWNAAARRNDSVEREQIIEMHT